MTSFVSNDYLCDTLKGKGELSNKSILEAFRSIDRGDFLDDSVPRSHAYVDRAMRTQLIHMSAPHLYARIMNGFELEKGKSFLNIGSGSGYFSCLVSHVVGPNGLCHGIEINSKLVRHSRICSDKWINKSIAKLREEHLSVHVNSTNKMLLEQNIAMIRESVSFVDGNCFHLDPSQCAKYDRIYVGAGCPDSHKEFFYNMLTVGGILIMSVLETNDLLKVRRLSELVFKTESILGVFYAPLLSVPSVDSDKLNNSVNVSSLTALREARRLMEVVTEGGIADIIDNASPTTLLCRDSCVRLPSDPSLYSAVQPVTQSVALPAISWLPNKHRFQQFPASFRQAALTLMMCSRYAGVEVTGSAITERGSLSAARPHAIRRPELGFAHVPQQLWIHVLTFCNRDWFLPPVTAAELLLHELLLERRLRVVAEERLAVSEKARVAAENERNVLRRL